MAMHLDHFSISSPNLFYGAHRLRLESTLSFYDGGHFQNGDHANRIFPLGLNTYLELNGIVNAESVKDPKNRVPRQNHCVAVRWPSRLSRELVA
jgi:hypothetical protein